MGWGHRREKLGKGDNGGGNGNGSAGNTASTGAPTVSPTPGLAPSPTTSFLPMDNDPEAFFEDINDPCWKDQSSNVDDTHTANVNSQVSNSKKTTVSHQVQSHICGC